jgi:hypothetical protein
MTGNFIIACAVVALRAVLASMILSDYAQVAVSIGYPAEMLGARFLMALLGGSPQK